MCVCVAVGWGWRVDRDFYHTYSSNVLSLPNAKTSCICVHLVRELNLISASVS